MSIAALESEIAQLEQALEKKKHEQLFVALTHPDEYKVSALTNGAFFLDKFLMPILETFGGTDGSSVGTCRC